MIRATEPPPVGVSFPVIGRPLRDGAGGGRREGGWRKAKPDAPLMRSNPRSGESTRQVQWIYSSQGQAKAAQQLGRLRARKPGRSRPSLESRVRASLSLSRIKGARVRGALVGSLVKPLGPPSTGPAEKTEKAERTRSALQDVWMEPRGKLMLSLCGSKPQRSALPLVACELGWAIAPRNAEALQSHSRAHAIWVVGSEDLNAVLQCRRPNQRVSRIAGLHALCNKGKTALLMRCMEKRCPGMYDSFNPETWVLPGDRIPPSAFKNGPLIFKPNDGTQGTGIRWVARPRHLVLSIALQSCPP